MDEDGLKDKKIIKDRENILGLKKIFHQNSPKPVNLQKSGIHLYNLVP